MAGSNGKGSRPRPLAIGRAAYNLNYWLACGKGDAPPCLCGCGVRPIVTEQAKPHPSGQYLIRCGSCGKTVASSESPGDARWRWATLNKVESK